MKTRVKWFLFFWWCLVFVCSTASALTYQEAYLKASSSGEAKNYKVFQPAAASRIQSGIVDGLAATYSYTGDELTITVDMDQTDWNSVIVKQYFPGSGAVYISPGFQSPTGQSLPHRSSGFSFGGSNTEKYIIQLLQRDYEQYGNNSGLVCQNGIELGRYDEQSGLFQPVEHERHGLMCAWDVNGELQFEYIAITIRYLNPKPITIRIPKVPAADICALYDMPQEDRSQIVLSASSGTLHAQTDSGAQFSTPSGSLAVLVPEEAGNEAWTCTRLNSWGDNWDCPMLSTAETGLARRSALISTLDFDQDQSVREDNFTLEWRDESGKVRGYAQLYLSVSVGAPKPWPNYVAEWKPVPASRMHLEKKNFLPGMDAKYASNDGVLTLTIDEDDLPETANFGRAFYEITVDPPADSMAFAGTTRNTRNNIIGASQASDYQDQLLRTRDNAEETHGSAFLVSGNVFMTYHHLGSDMTVYMTSEMTGPFAGAVNVLSWWEEGDDPAVDDPFLVEYVTVRQESCVRVLSSTPYDSEEELPQVITQPVIIIPEGSLKNPNNAMEFVAHIYPQKGEKSRYYKLELLNPDGTPVDLEKGQYKVFLPFPDGITEEEKQNLELIHMTESHVEIENFSINGNTLHLTDAGIWFQAKSFSPFMLKWGEATEAEYPVSYCENGHLMQCEVTFDGNGIAQYCECSEAVVDFIGLTRDQFASGSVIELIINWNGEWMGKLKPEVYYAPVVDNVYGEWTTTIPKTSGSYAVKLMYGTLETASRTFALIDPLILPASLSAIEDEAFAATDVVFVVCPENLVSIGSRAFADCKRLDTIVIPNPDTVIAEDAFDGCSNVRIMGGEDN